MNPWRSAVAIAAWVVLIFLMLPIVVVVAASFSATGTVRVPFGAVSVATYAEFLSSPAWLQALGVSFALAMIGAFITTAVAVLAALAVARHGFPGQAMFELGILSPLILPHAAVALALFAVVQQFGLLGSFPGVLLAHVIITLPFAYRPIITAVHRYDRQYDEAGMSLGMAPARVFWNVTLPILRPGIMAGFLFAFIISFDEVTVTMFLKGPLFTTLPVQIFAEIQDGSGRIVPAISTLLIGMTVAAIYALDRLVGVDVFVSKDA
jgi:putative spermidine/putrescine transport system permease protein